MTDSSRTETAAADVKWFCLFRISDFQNTSAPTIVQLTLPLAQKNSLLAGLRNPLLPPGHPILLQLPQHALRCVAIRKKQSHLLPRLEFKSFRGHANTS